MQSVVIYGVGSPLVVDVEESLARRGVRVSAAIRNFDGESFLLNTSLQLELAAITADIKANPIIVPLFSPANRQHAVNEALKLGFKKAYTLIDPTVSVPQSFVAGQGVFINSGCTLGAASVLEDYVFLNRGACLGHHAKIGRFASIGPGAIVAGQVTIEKGALIGAGAVLLPKIRIGTNAVVGAGSVVTKNVPDNCMVLGNPARIAKTGMAGYRDQGVI